MCESFTEMGTQFALYGTFFSSCLLYSDYLDSKCSQSHVRGCVRPLYCQMEKAGRSGRTGDLPHWLMESVRMLRRSSEENWRGKKITRGATEGLIKELFNFGEHSFGAASHCYPAPHFLAPYPINLYSHCAPSFSPSLSPTPTRACLT